MFFNITSFKYIFKKFFHEVTEIRHEIEHKKLKTCTCKNVADGQYWLCILHANFEKKKKKKRFLFTKNFRVSAITPFSWKSFSEIFPQMSRNFFRKCILIPSYIHGQITQHNLNKRDISKFNFPTLHFLNGKYFPLDPFMHS